MLLLLPSSHSQPSQLDASLHPTHRASLQSVAFAHAIPWRQAGQPFPDSPLTRSCKARGGCHFPKVAFPQASSTPPGLQQPAPEPLPLCPVPWNSYIQDPQPGLLKGPKLFKMQRRAIARAVSQLVSLTSLGSKGRKGVGRKREGH